MLPFRPLMRRLIRGRIAEDCQGKTRHTHCQTLGLQLPLLLLRWRMYSSAARWAKAAGRLIRTLAPEKRILWKCFRTIVPGTLTLHLRNAWHYNLVIT